IAGNVAIAKIVGQDHDDVRLRLRAPGKARGVKRQQEQKSARGQPLHRGRSPALQELKAVKTATGRPSTPPGIQYASPLMDSPPAIVARECQVCGSTVSRTNRSDPSANRTFTPPGCRELGPSLPWLPHLVPRPGTAMAKHPGERRFGTRMND